MLTVSTADKEQWEPTIEYTIQRANVQEAWSFDWPNHGEGAMLNAQVIAARYPEGTGEWSSRQNDGTLLIVS
jgi:hypothetical protein